MYMHMLCLIQQLTKLIYIRKTLTLPPFKVFEFKKHTFFP